MAVEVCPKHDVVLKDGKCWCCQQNHEKTSAAKPSTSAKATPVATGGKQSLRRRMKIVITIHIQEGDSVKNSVQISITISPASSGGGSGSSPDLQIDASGVPTSGQVGVPFSGAIKVSGGTAPYTFSLNSGALPDGVSLMSDGSFSGTPTKDGDFSFEIGVSDSGV